MATRTNQYNPTSTSHPGVTLREKLDELGIGPKEFAVRTGKPEKTISEVLHGNSAITPDMAVLFESVLKIPARFWIQRQYLYEEARARQKHAELIEDANEWARKFPYGQMAKMGWVPPHSKIGDRATALLQFFGIALAEAWEDFFLKARLRSTFRISLSSSKSPHALSAWLRQGELQAAQLHAPPYSENLLRGKLPALKQVMATHPPDFFRQAQELCLQSGLKLVLTPCLSKAPINGAARWVQGSPLIQLSCRYKRNDIFWHSLFHELGHILLHGKKEIFLEDISYSDKDAQKEREADEFAIEWILSREQEALLHEANPTTVQAIEQLAGKWQTHPAMLVGRLQHLQRIPHHAFAELFVKIDLPSQAAHPGNDQSSSS